VGYAKADIGFVDMLGWFSWVWSSWVWSCKGNMEDGSVMRNVMYLEGEKHTDI
jgi:hypothetical protein